MRAGHGTNSFVHNTLQFSLPISVAVIQPRTCIVCFTFIRVFACLYAELLELVYSLYHAEYSFSPECFLRRV